MPLFHLLVSQTVLLSVFTESPNLIPRCFHRPSTGPATISINIECMGAEGIEGLAEGVELEPAQ